MYSGVGEGTYEELQARTAQVHMPLLFSGFFLKVEGENSKEAIKTPFMMLK